MTYYNHGLGDFGSLGDNIDDAISQGFVFNGVKTAPGSIDAARAAWYQWVGVPYTGNVTDPQILNSEINLAVRIANGDKAAALVALESSDAALRDLGAQMLRALPSLEAGVPNSQLRDLVIAGKLTTVGYQMLTGRSVAAEPWSREGAIQKILAAGFLPGIGGWARVRNDGTAEYLRYGWDTKYNQVQGGEWVQYSPVSVYDANYDYAGLRQAVLASYANSVKGQQVTLPANQPAPTAAIPTIKSDVPVTDPNAPPSGWRAGTLNGKAGWWAPDGLFYVGATPWVHYQSGTGQSITPPAPVVVPPLVPGSGVGHDGDAGPPAPPAAPPSAPPAPPSWSPPIPTSRVTTDLPPDGYTPTPQLVQPIPTATTAGVSGGGSGLLIGLGIAGAAAYFIFGRKH